MLTYWNCFFFPLSICNNFIEPFLLLKDKLMLIIILSRHTVVCRAAQENGACANGSEYINRNNKVAIFTHS